SSSALLPSAASLAPGPCPCSFYGPGEGLDLRRPSSVTNPNGVVSVSAPSGRAVRIGTAEKLSVIAGPCQLESRQHALETAQALKEIADRLGIGLIYKTSFDKANRTSVNTARGLGLAEALPVFAEIREATGLPTLTDGHGIR